MNFKILASSYDRRWKSYNDRSLGFLLEHLHLSVGEKILDVGCGTGNFESKLLSRGWTGSLTAVDPCVEMIEIARRKCAGLGSVEWHVAGAERLPVPDETFDCVVSANSFHYYETPRQALGEIRRVLKPEGTFWLLDWCRDFWTMKALDLFLGIVAKDYHRCYGESEVRDLLKGASFNVLSSETRKIGPLWGLMCVKGGTA